MLSSAPSFGGRFLPSPATVPTRFCLRFPALCVASALFVVAPQTSAQPQPSAAPAPVPAPTTTSGWPAPVAPPGVPTSAAPPTKSTPTTPAPQAPPPGAQGVPAQPPPQGVPPGYGPPPQGVPPGYGPPPQGVPPGYGPPGYGPPPGYNPYPYPAPYPYYAEPPPSSPTLEYEEGQEIPPGYRLERRVQKGLTIAGASIFGGAWILSIAGAASLIENNDGIAPLFVPLVGPFIAMGTTGTNFNQNTFLGALLLLDGFTQVAGATMMIVGIAKKKPLLVLEKNSTAALSNVVPEVQVGLGRASFTWHY